MKKHILTLIIGILIGAIITTAIFLILKGNTRNQINIENMPSMDGQFQKGGNSFSTPGDGYEQKIEDTSNSIEE